MEAPISKTQRKKEANALQALGVDLIKLSEEKLSALGLPDNLLKAILDAKLIKSHEAKRRQTQLIGKLMRAADVEAIHLAYQQQLDEASAVTANFRELELWRDKLIQAGKPALTEFIQLYQPEDIQELQHKIKKAVQDKIKAQNTGAAKALFRYLKGCIS